jgi:hypothetical protein
MALFNVTWTLRTDWWPARRRAGPLLGATRGQQPGVEHIHVGGAELVEAPESEFGRVAHRSDKADDAPSPAEVEPWERLAVAGQAEERVAGWHVVAIVEEPPVDLVLLGGGWVQLVPHVGAPTRRVKPGEAQLANEAVGMNDPSGSRRTDRSSLSGLLMNSCRVRPFDAGASLTQLRCGCHRRRDHAVVVDLCDHRALLKQVRQNGVTSLTRHLSLAPMIARADRN